MAALATPPGDLPAAGWADASTDPAPPGGAVVLVLHRLPRRLRLVFGVTGDTAGGPQSDSAEPLHEFVAYAADCRIFGELSPPDGRLTDLLNAYEEFELVNVHLQSLLDAHVVIEPSLLLSRDELIAVHAAGSAGHPGRRTRTRAHRLVVHSEPYTIWGDIHTLPGADPIASFQHRPPMIPLTDASIEYDLAGTTGRFRLGTLIVNCELAGTFAPVVDEEPEPPVLPPGDRGPLTKDFTGELSDDEFERRA